MNEINNLYSNETTETGFLKYTPGNHPLDDRTLPLEAKHYGPEENTE